MDLIITEDKISEYEPFEEDGSVLLAEETPWRGFSDELQELYYLKGSQFIHQLKQIVNSGEFRPIDGETDIFSAISEICDDFDNLVNAARKAVEHGYRVYILPNPKGIRTADYFELNPYAREVLVYKGKKQISVTRKSLEDTNFFRTFIRRYAK
jgi:hypothetical protein